ncbi:MAG: winged helix-turn-helix domain-containing protein [Novosphingobium sp.]|nr:winged helix-turn-helix domain-containing protein [Novosphingobium sp.]
MKTKRPTDEQIIEFVSSFDVGITPKVLAHKLNISHSTVKTILFRLAQSGKIKANFLGNRGFYGVDSLVSNKGDGMVYRTEPKIQNFQLIYRNCNIGQEYNLIEPFPSSDNPIWKVKINISKSNNLTILFSGEFGFDLSSVIILSKKYIDDINAKFNSDLDIDKLEVTNIEIFNDFYKVGLSRNSFYFSDLKGLMMKIYDKKGKLRVEKRISQRFPLTTLLDNISNTDIFRLFSVLSDISGNQQEIFKQIERLMKNQEYYNKKREL